MINRLFTTILFLSLSLTIFAQDDYKDGYLVRLGDQAPDFTAQYTDGSTFHLNDQKGKIVMLQFTASWCSVCRKEMPFIEKDIWKELKGDKFVVIGIDRDESLDVVTKFAEQMKISYPLVLDPKAGIFGLYADLKAGVTRNVIIDEKGKIIFLTRLFDMNEFNQMKAVIVDAVEKLN